MTHKVSPHLASVEFDIPLHDVDKMGIVWHGHYVKYMEYARTRLFQELGLGGEISGTFPYAWVVIETKLRHTAPLHFEDRARVEARLVDVDYRIHVAFEIKNLTTNQRSAKSHTMLATVKPGGEMLLETPAELLPYLTET